MSLRNQPYFPLYVQDYMTDEKLNECSAQSQGVYIKIICLMHKSDEYGVILLKQKDKQSESIENNFAIKIVKHLPFSEIIILKSIKELVEENVLFIDGNKLCQRRMIKDNKTSEARSKAGKKGGEKTQLKSKFAKAKIEAPSENENESIIEYNNDIKKEVLNSKIWFEPIFMQKRIDPNDGVDYLKIFLDNQGNMVGEGKGLNREIDEIKNHFVSWLSIAIKKSKDSNNGSKPTSRLDAFLTS